jgi:tRNA pseudouridine(55) synthase
MSISVYKNIGKSCTDLVNEIRQNYPPDTKIGFSGRLDEMAHGMVTILIGDETKNTTTYHNLNKIYKFRFIVGLETDTTSVLGLFNNKPNSNNHITNDEICNQIEKTKNTTFMQEYHTFSSFVPKHDKIKKPLWWWSTNNLIHEIKEMPKKEVCIYDVDVKNIKTISLTEFMNETFTNLSSLQDDKFRKAEIIDQWKKFQETTLYTSFVEFECEIKTSSGFYIRQYVKDLAQSLNINLLVTEINRIAYF